MTYNIILEFFIRALLIVPGTSSI